MHYILFLPGYWTAGNDIATEGTWVWTSDEKNTQ